MTVNRTGVVLLGNRTESLFDLNVIGHVSGTTPLLSVADRITVPGGSIDLGSGTLLCAPNVSALSVFSTTGTIDAGLIRLAPTETSFDVSNTTPQVELEIQALIANHVSGPSLLRKTDDGIVRLTAATQYTGGTVVQGGALRVDNFTGSGTGTGDVTVLSGGRLEGDGAISGLVLISASGTISPGSGGVGDLAVGTIILAANSRTAIELAGPTRGTEYDAIDVTGSASIAGQLHLSLLSGYDPQYYITHNILHAGSRTNSYATIQGLILPGNKHLAVTYDADDVFVTAAG